MVSFGDKYRRKEMKILGCTCGCEDKHKRVDKWMWDWTCVYKHRQKCTCGPQAKDTDGQGYTWTSD